MPVAVISSGGGSIPEWSKRSSGLEEGLILLPSDQIPVQSPHVSSKSSDGGTTGEETEDDDGPAWLPPEGVKFPQLGPLWFLPRLSDSQEEVEERAAEPEFQRSCSA